MTTKIDFTTKQNKHTFEPNVITFGPNVATFEPNVTTFEKRTRNKRKIMQRETLKHAFAHVTIPTQT